MNLSQGQNFSYRVVKQYCQISEDVSSNKLLLPQLQKTLGYNTKLQLVNGRGIDRASPTPLNMSISYSDLDAKSDQIFRF